MYYNPQGVRWNDEHVNTDCMYTPQGVMMSMWIQTDEMISINRIEWWNDHMSTINKIVDNRRDDEYVDYIITYFLFKLLLLIFNTTNKNNHINNTNDCIK